MVNKLILSGIQRKYVRAQLSRASVNAQPLADALEELEKQGRHPPFLQPCNIRFVAPSDATKGRYTGFAAKAEIINNGMALEEAKKCEETRDLLAPEILEGKPKTSTSASYSLFRMYYNALMSKLRLRETPVSVKLLRVP